RAGQRRGTDQGTHGQRGGHGGLDRVAWRGSRGAGGQPASEKDYEKTPSSHKTHPNHSPIINRPRTKRATNDQPQPTSKLRVICRACRVSFQRRRSTRKRPSGEPSRPPKGGSRKVPTMPPRKAAVRPHQEA